MCSLAVSLLLNFYCFSSIFFMFPPVILEEKQVPPWVSNFPKRMGHHKLAGRRGIGSWQRNEWVCGTTFEILSAQTAVCCAKQGMQGSWLCKRCCCVQKECCVHLVALTAVLTSWKYGLAVRSANSSWAHSREQKELSAHLAPAATCQFTIWCIEKGDKMDVQSQENWPSKTAAFGGTCDAQLLKSPCCLYETEKGHCFSRKQSGIWS